MAGPFSLSATDTISAVAGTNNVIAYTFDGDNIVAGVDTFKAFPQGLVPSSVGTIWSALAGQSLVYLLLSNTTASPVTGIKLFVNGTAATNQVGPTFTIPGNGGAFVSANSMQVFDSTGAVITTSTTTTTLTGDATGSGVGVVPVTFATVNVNVGTFGSASSVAQVTENAKGLTTAALSVPIQILPAAVTGFDTQVRTSRLDQMAAPTGPVSFNSQKITSVADATNGTDAPNFAQVQAIAEGRDDKEAVEWSTTGNITLSGLGTQGNGEWTAPITDGTRILGKDQTTSADKGIYDAHAGAWTRSTDANTGAEITGATVLVKQGATNRGDTWRQSATVTTIGSDPQTWVQIGEGDPLSLTAVGVVPNANAASLAGQALTLQPANGTFPGLLSAAGFTNLGNQSGANTGDVSLTASGAVANANGASLAGQSLTLQPASAAFAGLLTAAQFTKLANTSGTNTGDQNLFLTVTGNTGTATADTTTDSLSIVGSGVISTVASDNPEVVTISSAALTGDVTTVGAAATIAALAVTTGKIANDAVDNTKLANMPAHTFKGNNTAGSTDPLDLSIAQMQAELGTTGTNTGDVTLTAVGITANANAATLTGQALNLQPASASFPGVITSAQFTKLANTSGTNTGDQNLFASVTGNTGTATADTTTDTLAITGANGITTAATDTPDGLVITAPNTFGVITGNTGTATADVGGDTVAITGANGVTTAATDTPDGLVITGANAFGVVTGNSGTATSDTSGDTLALTGSGSVSTVATDTPDGVVISNATATFTAVGNLTAAEKIELNSLDGRTSAGATPRVFRPGDFMVGNTYDPTGTANSTSSFTAMMNAIRAHNDRCMIQLTPGVFKLDHDILKDFGTNNTSVPIRGPGRGTCILLPNSAPTGTQSMITFNRNTSGGDAIAVSGFTIYNTSGTVYTAGNGILTNGADGIDITEVAFIDLFNDIHVSGQPFTMTTNGTTSVTGISPAVTAADNGETVSGPGIVPGTTFTFVSSTSGTLSVAATTSATAVRFLDTTIKCSIQKMVNFNTNGGGVGIVVNNGQAGDTYMGPDIVMSDGGGTTRRRACIELIESGHYEITQANLTGSQRGILIDPAASQSVAFGFHTNVLCDSNSINGMRVDATTATSTIKNIKSVNSWYSGTVVINGSAAAAGVLTVGAGVINGFTYTTDRFLNNRTHGFEHTVGTDFRWSDCDMKGNSSVGSNTADGLNVAANIGNWSINGGKYGGTDTVPTVGNQRWGIFVAAGTGNNIKVGPDDLTGNVTGPLSMGATGQSVFINGCPGLIPTVARGSATAAITTAEVVVASLTIPKNSVRVGTTINIYGQGIISNTTTQSVWTNRVRMGTTTLSTPIVGSDVLNSGIIARTNFPLLIFGSVTFYAIGAGGTALGHFQLVGGLGSAGVVTTGSTALTAAVAVDTTADRLCEFTIIGATGTPSITIHNAVITVNY